MTSHRTPKARLGRTGRWASLTVAAAVLLALLAILPTLPPTEASTTATLKEQLTAKQAILDQAYTKLDTLQDNLNKLADAYNAAESQESELEDQIQQAEQKISSSALELDSARIQLEQRLVGIYKDSSDTTSYYLDVFFSETDLASVFDRFDALDQIAKDDQELFDHVENLLEQSKANKALLVEKKAEQTAEMTQLQQLQNETSDKLATASSEYKGIKDQIDTLQSEIKKADARAAAAAAARRAAILRAKAAAAAAAAAAAQGSSGSTQVTGFIIPGPFTFPVAGPHSYVDSWGAPRSGGRRHQGCDIMAARNTPLVACVNGTISRVNPYDTGLGGRSIYVRSASGVLFYYAHLNSIATGMAAGKYVTAGQIIGYVGNSGDAAGGPTHCHFGIIYGGVYIDPYPTLRAHDG